MDLIAVIVVVVLIIVVFRYYCSTLFREGYDGGNNINFELVKTDMRQPDKIMAHSDVYTYRRGDGYKILHNW